MKAPVRVLDARVVSGSGGGPDKTILRSPRHLDPTRVAMSAVYLRAERDEGFHVLRDAAERHGCPLHEVIDRGPLDLGVVRRLADLCRALDINVWHGHDYKTDVLGLVLRRLHPMKLVTTVHGFTRETWRTRLYYHADNLALRGYDHVLAVSPPLRDHCLTIGVRPERLSYVPNAIEADNWRRSRDAADAKRELGIDPHTLTITVVSRLSVEKGVDRALRLLASLKKTLPSVRMLLVGDGPERGTLSSLAAQLGVCDHIEWCGWQADTRRHYEAGDLLLLPSHTEGLPNVVLEAMAASVAVAATDVGGVRDLLDDGACGIVLPAEDPVAWTAPVAALLAAPVERRLLAARALARVRDHFSFARRMQRITEIYEQLLTPAPPARRAA